MFLGRGRVAAVLRLRIPRDSASLSRLNASFTETARTEDVFALRHEEIVGCPRWFGTSRLLFPVIPCVSSSIDLRSCGITTAAVASAPTASEGSRKWRFSMIFLFLPCLATFVLGTWQLIRREKKIEMLDYRRKRLEEEPQPLYEIIDETKTGAKPTGATTDDLEYRKVICEGVYDGTKSLYVGPRARSDFGVAQKGYYLLTPLVGGHGDNSLQVPVLVNRGWVPSGFKGELPDKAAALENIPTTDINSEVDQGSWWRPWSKGRTSNKKDEVKVPPKDQSTMKVCGVIRGSEQPNMFVPPNAPEAGQWFYVDVPAMARAVGLPEDTVLIEAVQEKENSKANNKYPIPKDPEALLRASVMPQDHINYALTWYTLSAATTFMAVKRVRNSRRGF